MSKTYVFGEIEVVLTGKIAKREINTSSRRRKGIDAKVDTKHEITPANQVNGSWTKWVRMSDLYEIDEKGEE